MRHALDLARIKNVALYVPLPPDRFRQMLASTAPAGVLEKLKIYGSLTGEALAITRPKGLLRT